LNRGVYRYISGLCFFFLIFIFGLVFSFECNFRGINNVFELNGFSILAEKDMYLAKCRKILDRHFQVVPCLAGHLVLRPELAGSLGKALLA